jgi:hypothetical protein
MSKAFMAHGITPPATMGWQRTMDGGWVCEVWQSAYSHRANKKTWLYYFGENPPAELKWERIVGTHQVGQECRQGRRKLEPWRNKPTLSKREANATPESFRDALLALALRATQHQANGAAMTLPAKAELNRPIAVRFGNWLADESMKT